MIGTSLGGVLSDKFTSKRWLIISISIFIIMMIILNLLLPGTGLLGGLFMWNLMQWSTNPAIQSGIIEHVEGDTSQVMSWNMSSLNAGIGVGGIVGGLVMTHLSVEYVTYTSALIGLISLIIVFTLKIDIMLKFMTGKGVHDSTYLYDIRFVYAISAFSSLYL